ncbi:MAG TPA: TlpA disulfide reductase family protein, partial [Gemmatimonadaceae bacterium]
IAGCIDGGAPRAEIGEPAPTFHARTVAGDTVSLASLRGKVVLLNIWATWCAPCREEIPYLQQLHEQYADSGLVVVGVSVDARGQEEEVGSFAAELGMTYPIWLDPDQRVTTRFLSMGVPTSYLIDRASILRWKHLGVLRESNLEFQEALHAALEPLPR